MSSSESAGRSEPADVFMNLARIVYGGGEYRDIYREICNAAVEVIPGCDHACITTLRGGGDLETEAASDQVAATVDDLERQTGEGPCLDAILEERFQHDPDIAEDSAWPALSKVVLEQTPVRGMIGYRLFIGDRKAGSLNVFSDTPDALTIEAADIGAIVASFASVALAGAAANDRADNLQRGLESNREIGKAIGLLMATHRVDEDQAFDVLRRASSEMNVKLAEVARRLVQDRDTRP
jgi:transcriptional regulator with GAF, ATPase, and Fis domain